MNADPVFRNAKKTPTLFRSPGARAYWVQNNIISQFPNKKTSFPNYLAIVNRILSGGVYICPRSKLKECYVDHASGATSIENSCIEKTAIYHNVELEGVTARGLPGNHLIIAGNVKLKNVNAYVVRNDCLVKMVKEESSENNSDFTIVDLEYLKGKDLNDCEAYYFPSNDFMAGNKPQKEEHYHPLVIVTNKEGRILRVYKSNTISMGADIDEFGVKYKGGLPSNKTKFIDTEDEVPNLALVCGQIHQSLHNLAHSVYHEAYNDPDSLRAWSSGFIAGFAKSLTGLELHQGAQLAKVRIAILPTSWSLIGRILKLANPRIKLPKSLTVIGQEVIVISKNNSKHKTIVYLSPEDIVTLGATGERKPLSDEILEELPELKSTIFGREPRPLRRHPVVYLKNMEDKLGVQLSTLLGPAESTMDAIQLQTPLDSEKSITNSSVNMV